ncbi:hypothetical protein [Pseudomonas sp. ESBL1]|uniref:hypothetical protein n=1 Tax=Pseudomonas sp. ESBL1 TaxID=3077324 RepID=UPI002FC7F1B5
MSNPMKSRCWAVAMTALVCSPALFAKPAGGLEFWVIGGGVIAAIGFWIQALEYVEEASHG